jgi:hypothetical protein
LGRRPHVSKGCTSSTAGSEWCVARNGTARKRKVQERDATVIKCLKFRPYRKNTLQGFCDLQLVRTGLVIRDCCLHEKAGKYWISFPARSYPGKDGNTQWATLIEFADDAGESREAFQHLAVAAVRAFSDNLERGAA